ncbi:hypothetical protein Tco_0922658 [Tanacetum coccineum]|uniref:Uncharacterized protein n=1 Tax=Tanacetum coccineum TaxID=301880 RepID=A0ABQ5CZQ3_9ASTR
MQEEWEAEEERNRIAEENAANEDLIRDFNDIKARIKADRLLAEKLQEQEREQFTIEERAKFLHDTIAAQEIQALYEKIKRSDEDFISIGSAEDERLIKKMNEKRVDSSKDEMIKEQSKEEVKKESKEEVQEESKEEESKKKRKLGTRKKMKSRKRRYIQNTSEDDSDKENDELRLHLTIAPDEEKEVDYEILDIKYPIKEWKTECLRTKPQTDQAEHLEEINLNVVIRSNGQKRYFSTLMTVLSIFDREDLNAVYQLVMEKYQDEMPKGFDRVLWGDLMILFNPDDKDEFWSSQLDWIIVSWKLHSSLGIHTLVTDTGLVIHMLVEKKYPLRKEVLMQMLKLKLESEEESTMALELIKFVKTIIAELELEELQRSIHLGTHKGQGSLPSNTITNSKEDLKGITTRSGTAYQGPTIPTFSPKVVEHRTEVTKDIVFPTNNGITEDVQPSIVRVEKQNPVSEPDVAPVSAPMPNPKPSIPYPSRKNNERHRENANEQKEKFYEIFKDMSFEISGSKAVVSAAVGNEEMLHMTGNKSFLTDYQEIDGGFVAFGGSPKGGFSPPKGSLLDDDEVTLELDTRGVE